MISGQPHWVVSGGIGSGKSAVRRLLDAFGFFTVDADTIGHEVLRVDGAAFDAVAGRWPATVVDGEIDRSALGRIVFEDLDELRELERITHPHIFGTIRELIQEIHGPVAVEIPLFEHGLGPGWKRMIVDCADETRLSRLVARGSSEFEAGSRMAAQPSRGEWLAIADLVVPNHGSLEDLEGAVRVVVSAP